MIFWQCSTGIFFISLLCRRLPFLASFSDDVGDPWSSTHVKRFQLGWERLTAMTTPKRLYGSPATRIARILKYALGHCYAGRSKFRAPFLKLVFNILTESYLLMIFLRLPTPDKLEETKSIIKSPTYLTVLSRQCFWDEFVFPSYGKNGVHHTGRKALF